MNEQQWYEIEGFTRYLVNPYDCKIMNKESKHMLSPVKNKGYLYVILRSDDKKPKTVALHRLFIHLLPGNGEVVNHIDGNKENWNINNLELVSRSENMRHAVEVLGKIKHSYGVHIKKPVRAIHTITNEIIEFEYIREAAKYLDINHKHISAILHGKQKTAKKWTFEFIDEPEIPDLTNFKPYPHDNTYLISEDGKIYTIKLNRFISTKMCGNYVSVNSSKFKSCYLHRILAETFIPNPDNHPIVDHIDRNPLNNSLENLRWVDIKTNANNKNHNIANKIAVAAYKAGNIVKVYDSIVSVEKDGFKEHSVRKCSKSNGLHKGFVWKRITKEEHENFCNNIC